MSISKIIKLCPICNMEYNTYKTREKKTCSLKCSYIQRGLDKTINLLSNRFGQLVVIKYVGSINKKVVWECQCDCGSKKTVNAGDLLRKDNKRIENCGNISHRSGENSPAWKGYLGISSRYFSSVKLGAAKRGLEFDLTYKDMADKFTGKCALSGIPIFLEDTASLDRIDSTLGYIPNNVQWVHKDVNRMKSDFKESDFLKWCNLISKFTGDSYEL